jgi:hypothetical protein
MRVGEVIFGLWQGRLIPRLSIFSLVRIVTMGEK